LKEQINNLDKVNYKYLLLIYSDLQMNNIDLENQNFILFSNFFIIYK